jgi:hypothetical protein
MTAQVLWAFSIDQAVDRYGKVIELDPDAYEVGMFAEPLPFKVRIIPKTAKHAEVVRKAASEAQEYLDPWE